MKIVLTFLLFGGTIFVSAVNRGELLSQAPEKEASRPNPYAAEEWARKAGRKLFQRECATCHGREAEGGMRAPALNRTEVRQAPPGAIVWVLRNGSLRHGMPSFAHLPEGQRWEIVAFLQGKR